MLFFTLIILAVAVSLDSFSVGVTYGMRRISVPLKSLLIIMLCSLVVVLISMTIGSLISSFISVQITQITGGMILIFMGLLSLYNTLKSKQDNFEQNNKLEESILKKVIIKNPSKKWSLSNKLTPNSNIKKNYKLNIIFNKNYPEKRSLSNKLTPNSNINNNFKINKNSSEKRSSLNKLTTNYKNKNELKIQSKKKDKNKKFELFFSVLNKPDQADLDNSGVISGKEALLLGFALALDAFGSGLGAAMLGYSPLITATLISFMSGLFVFLGIKSGFMLSHKKWMQHLAFLPPLLLISIGLVRLF